MNLKSLLPVICLTLFLFSCRDKEKYPEGYFPEEVINFNDVNTPYDDYNSDMLFVNHRYLLKFSSNRHSVGGEFDVVAENLFIDWDTDSGELRIDPDVSDNSFDFLHVMYDTINTDCNELGPYSIVYISDTEGGRTKTYLSTYASDCQGQYDINFSYSTVNNPNTNDKSYNFSASKEVKFINTDANELYLTFYGDGFHYGEIFNFDRMPDPAKIETILYCSDAKSTFNIYEQTLPDHPDIIEALASETVQSEAKKLAINSTGNDKCPFVNGKLLVFTSDRPGGFGGFDLYYSVNQNGEWTEPVNFGEHINTEYDEYRPIVLNYHDFVNNLMIFSSNRPGGKGGFDLYYTGIDKAHSSDN